MVSRARIIIVLIAFFLIGGYLGFRLFDLQVVNHEYWLALAQGQQNVFVQSQEERGRIYFADMTPLAINKDFSLVYAVPTEIEHKEDTADALSEILGTEESAMLASISKNSLFAPLKQRATEEEVERLNEVTLPGIYVRNERHRYYPHETMASRVIGFLGGEGRGNYGVEGYYDTALQGGESSIQKEKGPGGYEANYLLAAEQGSDLVLTIDYNLQFKAEQLLAWAHENLEIRAGEIIVTDPHSGKILAMAVSPSFNLNEYHLVTDFNRYKNTPAQAIFEPGSIFKVITLAAALDRDLITPNTTFEDTGSVFVGGHTLNNYDRRTWGEQTMTQVLEKSINTGAVHAQQLLGKDAFLEYVERFGFFDRTDTDIQGEVSSQNRELRIGYAANLATAAFGQGIEVTSMQVIRAFGAVANGGTLYRPYVVDRISQNGDVFENEPHIQADHILSQRASAQITAMMTSTVESGFSSRAQVEGYHLAGKTGTAQVPWGNLGINRSGYSDQTIQSFIGYGPSFNPQFLIFVKLHDPQTRTAEYSAVPIFRDMAKYIIDYWQIPPDYDIENE